MSIKSQIGNSVEGLIGHERRLIMELRRLEHQVTWFMVLLSIIISLYPRYTIAQSVGTGGTTTPNMVGEAPFLLPKTTTKQVWLTAYTSSPEETDDTPFITASGKTTGDGIAAANFLPFGTKFKVPEIFGEKTFVVEDRMHPRKANFVDLWVSSKEEAYQIGKRRTEILIIEG
jgi:3D (Asp-Asp-Asp) domain-containing protein